MERSFERLPMGHVALFCVCLLHLVACTILLTPCIFYGAMGPMNS